MATARHFITVGALALAAALPLAARAQERIFVWDFNSGDDSFWYTRHDPLRPFGAPGTWSFPPGAYRMQGDASPDPDALGVQRVFSTLNFDDASSFLTSFTIRVDVLDWNPDVRTSIGMFVNLREVGVGTTDGYFLHMDVGGSGPSIVAFDRFDNDQLTSRTFVEIPALSPNSDYSMILMPGFTANFFGLYDLAQLAVPLAFIPLHDADPLPAGLLGFGTTGVVIEPGVFVNSPVDATFDNFVAAPAPGAPGLLAGATLLAVRRRRR